MEVVAQLHKLTKIMMFTLTKGEISFHFFGFGSTGV
jgi:hypothetical protein